MGGMVKKLISTIAAAAVALAVVTLPRAPGSVAEAAVTGGCDGNHGTVWTGGALASGSYYLTGNVDLASQIEIGSGVDVSLCLNGFTVTAAASSRVFYINGGTLTLCDCNSSGNGQGKLTGGNIRNVSGDNTGGCILINGNGTFIMNGGEISGNNALTGGGVGRSDGTFTMNGGKICENSASNGGGVYYYGTLIMKGGEISNNSATYQGGGIYISGELMLDGKVKIIGNTAPRDNTNNVFFRNDSTIITIGSNFETASPIGVSYIRYNKLTCEPTGFINITNTLSEDLSSVFTADREEEYILWDDTDNKVKLAKKHTFSGEPTTTAPTCTEPGTETGTCTVCTQTVTKTTPALGHSWGEWVTTKEPTTTEKGEKTRTCTNNSEHIETVEIPKKSSGSSGGSSGGSSSSSSGSTTDELLGDSQKESGNPATGTTTALLPTVIIAAAAMLLTKRRKN